MKTTTKLAIACCLPLAQATAFAATTDISQMPLDAKSQATPNLIFGIDDSGSMDSEVLLATNDGALWWDAGTRTFWSSSGVLNFNTNGVAGSGGGTTWYKYVYLFPERHRFGQPHVRGRDLRPLRASRPRRRTRSCAAPRTTPCTTTRR